MLVLIVLMGNTADFMIGLNQMDIDESKMVVKNCKSSGNGDFGNLSMMGNLS